MGMPSDIYSGSILASMRHTTLTGPPSLITQSKSLNILSSRSSIAAMTSVDSSGTAISPAIRSEEHTSELQTLMRNSYAVFCLKQNTNYHSKPLLLCRISAQQQY